MPPEFHEWCVGCETSFDIFSFGQLVLYIIVQEFPIPTALTYEDSNKPGVILGHSEVQRRIQHIEKFCRLIGGMAQSLVCVIVQCLQNDPRQRPSAKQVLHQLQYEWIRVDDTFEEMAKVELMVQVEVQELNLDNDC